MGSVVGKNSRYWGICWVYSHWLVQSGTNLNYYVLGITLGNTMFLYFLLSPNHDVNYFHYHLLWPFQESWFCDLGSFDESHCTYCICHTYT